MISKIAHVLGVALVATLFSLSVAAAAPRLKVEVADSPTLGPADAPVTMVEFIDFQ